MQPIEFGPLSEIVSVQTVARQFEKVLASTKERFPAESQAQNYIEGIFADHIAAAVSGSVLPQIETTLLEAYDTYEMIEGSRPDDPVAAVAWDEKLGETIEPLLASDIAIALGQGWLGENTIGPKFHEPGTIERIAIEAAAGFGKHVASTTTPEAVGLHQADLLEKAKLLVGIPVSLDRRGGKNAPKKTTPADRATRAKVVLSAVAGLLLAHKPEELIPELDLIGDFDEVLSPGAAERLGIRDQVVIDALVSSYADAPAKRTWAEVVVREAQNFSVAGGDAISSAPAVAASSAVDASATETATGAEPLSVAPPLATERPKQTRNKRKNTVVNMAAVTGLNELLKVVSQQTIAEMLSCTKSTISNYQSGKTPFAATPDEILTLRQKSIDISKGLEAAVAAFDAALLE